MHKTCTKCTDLCQFEFLFGAVRTELNQVSKKIGVRGDGRVILYKRSNSESGPYHVRVRVPGTNGYKRCSTKRAALREAELFALNLYEELYFHVRDGGTLNALT